VNKDKLWCVLRHQIGNQTGCRATEWGPHLHRETHFTVPETSSVAGVTTRVGLLWSSSRAATRGNVTRIADYDVSHLRVKRVYAPKLGEGLVTDAH